MYHVQLFLVSHVPFLFSCSASWYPWQCFHTAILSPELIFASTQKTKQCTFLHRWQNFSTGYLWTGLLAPFLVWWLPNYDCWQVLHRTNNLANALSAKWNIGLYLILNTWEIEHLHLSRSRRRWYVAETRRFYSPFLTCVRVYNVSLSIQPKPYRSTHSSLPSSLQLTPLQNTQL